MARLGDVLLRDGVIDQEGLSRALAAQEATGGYLGQHLVELGLATREQVTAAVAESGRVGSVRLGDVLVARRVLSTADLARAVERQREQGGYLGQHLVELGLATREQVDEAIAETGRASARRLGDVLIDSGAIDTAGLQRALAAQQREGGMLGQHLVLLDLADRRQIRDAIAEQLELPTVDLVADPPDPELILGIDPEVVSQRGWLPVGRNGRMVRVASHVPPTEAIAEEAKAETGAADVSFLITTWWDLDQAVAKAFRDQLADLARNRLAEMDPRLSAERGLLGWQKVMMAVGAMAIVGGLFIWPRDAVLMILVLGNAVFAFGALFKVITSVYGMILVRDRDRYARAYLGYRGLEHAEVAAWRARESERHLPSYTVLVPTYREANIVGDLISHLSNLDYPRSKLQILLLLEEEDTETLAAAKAAGPPEELKIVVVPKGDPQTKPRACNYGLSFATGELLVIYDAEDVPDPQQLRVIGHRFEQAPDNIVCIQAALNYYNKDYNILTRMFALEYSAWFDAMLPGLDALRLPIPLGGTSNHFRTRILRDVGGWDPHNVTEDADLGLRTEALGYRVEAAPDTVTWEEACSDATAWIKQRTRWIKGYLVTAAVHLRSPGQYVAATGWRGLLGMSGLILGTPLMFLMYPFVWAVTLLFAAGLLGVPTGMPQWLLTAGTINMVVGNLAAITISAAAAKPRHGWRVMGYALLNPFYWVMHSVAAWRALYQLIFDPHRWEKTPHGLHLNEPPAVPQQRQPGADDPAPVRQRAGEPGFPKSADL